MLKAAGLNRRRIMAVEYRIIVSGTQRVIAELEGSRKRMMNLEPALKKSGVMMLRSIDRNFERQGRPKRWASLSPKYALRKAALGGSNLILVGPPSPMGGKRKFKGVPGSLRSSITYDAEPVRLTIGTAISYAKYHHFGTMKMPQRRFLLFQNEDIRNIGKLVKEHVIGQTKNG